MADYILISESALDSALVAGGGSQETRLPLCGEGVHLVELSASLKGYRVANEPEVSYFALIGIEWIELLVGEGGDLVEIFRRIARVVKGLRSPPVHLPRQWSEYHHRNLLAFFALPRDISNIRWIIELGGGNRCARFDLLTSSELEINLANFSSPDWPDTLLPDIQKLLSAEIPHVEAVGVADALTQEVDLKAIGSASVVSGRSFDEWKRYITVIQKEILEKSVDSSIRIVGPAGSGKTLSLCMRALQTSRDDEVVTQGKRLLMATHSWAMSERIDGVLRTLNAGVLPDGITVFPLLSLLELHAGHIGQRKTDVIGDDSTDGRLKSLEIIAGIVAKLDLNKNRGVSKWVAQALAAEPDARSRLDLIINIYEEISGVLTASGVAPDDPEAIQEYLSSKREDWMPPFVTAIDSRFRCLCV